MEEIQYVSQQRYRDVRDELGCSRDAVCSMPAAIDANLQPERLARIENGIYPITPKEVMLLAQLYREPALCNYHCSKECPIGKKYVPEVKVNDLPRITLEALTSLNDVKEWQDRFMEISADGAVSADEMGDFVRIQEDLDRVSLAVNALRWWVEEMVAEKAIDAAAYKRCQEEE